MGSNADMKEEVILSWWFLEMKEVDKKLYIRLAADKDISISAE